MKTDGYVTEVYVNNQILIYKEYFFLPVGFHSPRFYWPGMEGRPWEGLTSKARRLMKELDPLKALGQDGISAWVLRMYRNPRWAARVVV